MNPISLSSTSQVFPLRGGWRDIALHSTGLRHPRFARGAGQTFTSYSDITHISASATMFRMGTRHSVYSIPRVAFAEPHGADRLTEELMKRIALEPGGSAQRGRMWEVEKLAARPHPPRACVLVAVLCLVVFVFERLVGPLVSNAGFLSRTLVANGEPWRLVTANLLHSDVAHLAFNLLGLVVIGALAERSLGAARTFLVMGSAAGGAMLAGLWAGYEYCLGSSGIVMGLVGAVVWLEVRCAEKLPADWRIPRMPLLILVALEAVISFGVPWIAGAAHMGGFLGGMGATAMLARPALERRRPRIGVLAANLVLLFVVSASLAAAGWMWAEGGKAIVRRAALLIENQGVPPMVLNNYAWIIATDSRSSPEDCEIAIRLAERAVEETDWTDPNIIDTLAEAQFAAGRTEEAIRSINSAIDLAPSVQYFREQRLRFKGHRARDDRPEPPSEEIPRAVPKESPKPKEPERPYSPEDGIRA